MKIFAFQNETLSENEQIKSLIGFFQDQGHEMVLYKNDQFEVLDDDHDLSRIADTAIQVAEVKPDMVFAFKTMGLIPWLYESMRIPYVDFLLSGEKEPWKDLEHPDMRMYGESDYCWIFCPDKKAAQAVQETGYIHTLIGDAALTDPTLLKKLVTGCKSIVEALAEKVGHASFNKKQQASASLFRLSCQLIFDSKWELAAKTLEGALEQNEDNDDAFYYLIALLEKLGRGKEAKTKLSSHLNGLSEEEHKEALEVRADAYCAVGLGQEAEGEFEQAVDSYQKAIRLNQECFLAYNNLGALLLRAQNVELAQEYLEAALKIQDSYSPTYFNLALLHENAGKYAEAIEAAETFMDLTPDTQADLLQCGRDLINRLEEKM